MSWSKNVVRDTAKVESKNDNKDNAGIRLLMGVFPNNKGMKMCALLWK